MAAPTLAAAQPVEVSLQTLLTFAEQHAPATRVAAERGRYAEAARQGASAALGANPTLEVAAGPRFDPAGVSGLDFTASLALPVEIAGQRSSRLQAAERLGDRLVSEVALSRWQIRREVILAYRAGVVAGERVRIAEQLVAFAQDMLRIARRRLDAGDGTAIELRIAEAEAAHAQQGKLLAEQEQRQAQLTLCEVSGWPLATPPLPRAALAAPSRVPPLAQLLDVAAERHPELRAKRAAISESQARVAVADREAWPTPVFGVGVEREAHRSGRNSEGTNYIVLGSIGLPLPFWQLNQAERARARVGQGVARSEAEAATGVLQARVARAHAELQGSIERVQIYDASLAPSLESSLALLRRGLDAGEIPLLDVAVARERFLQMKNDALSAYGDCYRALAELEYLTGVELTSLEAGRLE